MTDPAPGDPKEHPPLLEESLEFALMKDEININLIRQLCIAGADVNRPNKKGKTLIALAFESERYDLIHIFFSSTVMETKEVPTTIRNPTLSEQKTINELKKRAITLIKSHNKAATIDQHKFRILINLYSCLLHLQNNCPKDAYLDREILLKNMEAYPYYKKPGNFLSSYSGTENLLKESLRAMAEIIGNIDSDAPMFDGLIPQIDGNTNNSKFALWSDKKKQLLNDLAAMYNKEIEKYSTGAKAQLRAELLHDAYRFMCKIPRTNKQIISKEMLKQKLDLYHELYCIAYSDTEALVKKILELPDEPSQSAAKQTNIKPGKSYPRFVIQNNLKPEEDPHVEIGDFSPKKHNLK